MDFLQDWFLSQCDNDWEHGYGVRIQTLDNPGWLVEINIEDTPCENNFYESLKIERSEHDWIHSWIEHKKFNIACGPKNLSEALEGFRKFVLS